MKKILLINWRDINNPEAGGAEIHYHEIFKRIAKNKDYDITILSTAWNGSKPKETIDGLKVIRKGSPNLFNFWIYLNINNFVKSNNFDIIIDDVNKIPFYLSKIIKNGPPVMALFHHIFGDSIYNEVSFPFSTYVSFSESLIGKFYKDTPFCPVSDSTMDELVEMGLNSSNGEIIHNGIDLESFVPAEYTEKKKQGPILFIGRIKKYKNIEFILKVAALTKNKGYKFCIAGFGNDTERLKELAEKLNVTDYVTFAGKISEEEKLSLLQKASIFINPSIKEGWGITNIEAAACGTPVLASNVQGLRDSVKEGESGYLYEYDNLEDFSKKLKIIMEEEIDYKTLTETSRTWGELFSWDNSAIKMETFIKKLL